MPPNPVSGQTTCWFAEYVTSKHFAIGPFTVWTNPYINPPGYSNSVKIGSYSGSGSFYCLFGLPPTYTSESTAANDPYQNTYTTSNGESIALNYEPGVYNLTINNNNETLYGACGFTADITSVSQTEFNLAGGEKLYVLTEPQLGINISSGGSWQQYNPANPGENYIVTNTAPQQPSPFSSGGILFNPNGGALIQSCPTNSTVENYTVCTSIAQANAVIPGNGSFDSLEAIPSLALGNYNNSAAGNYYGPANYIGGGCFVGTENGNT